MNARRKLSPSLLVFLILFLGMMTFLVETSRADDDDDDGGRGKATAYTLASLQGTYGTRLDGARGGAPVGAIGNLSFDGAGHFSGLSIWNVAGDIKEFPVEGSYTVSSDGFFELTAEDGGSLLAVTGVIMRSRKIRRTLVALEASMISIGLGPGENVITLVITRRSNR